MSDPNAQWQPPVQGYGPPQPPTAPPRRSGKPWWKTLWFVGLVAALVGVGVGAASAGGSSKTKAVPGPTVSATVMATETFTHEATATATVTERPVVRKVIATRTRTETYTFHPTYTKFGEGTYVVGSDIKAGLYHTAGGSELCYWARLSSLDTGDILDNGNSTGPQTIEVHSGDRALEIQGDCTFGRA